MELKRPPPLRPLRSLLKRQACSGRGESERARESALQAADSRDPRLPAPEHAALSYGRFVAFRFRERDDALVRAGEALKLSRRPTAPRRRSRPAGGDHVLRSLERRRARPGSRGRGGNGPGRPATAWRPFTGRPGWRTTSGRLGLVTVSRWPIARETASCSSRATLFAGISWRSAIWRDGREIGSARPGGRAPAALRPLAPRDLRC
jgi:hypothetical protein